MRDPATSHAVIIPHFNDTARLRRCLNALASQDRSDTEVLVVDNGSTEAVASVAEAFPWVRLVIEPAKGAALARNRGVAESCAEWLFFLDADCVPSADWLTEARRAVRTSDIVGGAVDVFDETPAPRSGAEAFETVFAFNYRDYYDRQRFALTANLLTNRTVFEATGPFINGLSEDAEWCHRAQAKGFRLTLDERLRVSHPTRSDWEALRRKWHRIARELFEWRRAKGDGMTLRLNWAMRAVAMALSPAAHLPKIAASSRLSPGDRIRASGTLIRLRTLRAYWMLRQALGLRI